MIHSVNAYGDSAILVNFNQNIEKEIHHEVMTLYHSMTSVPGIRYMIPAYCSLTIVFDTREASIDSLKKIIGSWETHFDPKTIRSTNAETKLYTIPVCYDAEMAPDLEEVCNQTGKTIEEIINAHTSTEFYVYMVGFMPGFAYMGDMPGEFYCNRKAQPRTRVPQGSVGLSGLQSGIYPFESPGGWQIIGKTPLKLFDTARTPPALLAMGDSVRFSRVSKTEYLQLLERDE